MDKYDAYEKYQEFDEQYPRQPGANRYAKPKPGKKKPKPAELQAQLSDFDDNIAAWVPSYAAALDPRHYERQWLIESIGPVSYTHLDVYKRQAMTRKRASMASM